MNDIFKQELAIGDIVAFNPPTYKGLLVGRIIAFTPKMVRVEWNTGAKYDPIRSTVLWPQDTVKKIPIDI